MRWESPPERQNGGISTSAADMETSDGHTTRCDTTLLYYTRRVYSIVCVSPWYGGILQV
jgi:hypothetical protein